MSQDERGSVEPDPSTPTPRGSIHPDTQAQADALIETCIETLKKARDFADLEPAVNTPELWYRELLKQLHMVKYNIDNLQKKLVVQGVVDHNLSKKKAADEIGVHQATVARWVKEIEPITSSGIRRIDQGMTISSTVTFEDPETGHTFRIVDGKKE